MTRTYEQLSAEDRGVIMALSSQGSSARAIARTLERAPSTITRELRRNGFQREHEQCVMGRPRVAGGYNAQRASALCLGPFGRLAKAGNALGFSGGIDIAAPVEPENVAAVMG